MLNDSKTRRKTVNFQLILWDWLQCLLSLPLPMQPLS
jgi:hypothetical protein